MPYLVALAGLVAAAYIWIIRARHAAEVTQDLAGVASDVMAAARRFGFRRRHDTHAVDNVDDRNLAIGGLAVAFMELAGLPTAEQQNAVMTSLRNRLDVGAKDAEEYLILGRWLMNECNGPQPGIARLSRRLAKIDRERSFEPLMAVLKDVALASRGGLSDRQREALAEVSRAFKVG